MADTAAPPSNLADGASGIRSLWSPIAAVNALKTTIGVITAWFIVLWLQWPEPFMAPLAVVALQTPYLGASLQKGLMRITGTMIGALLALLLMAWLVQEQWLLSAALSAVVGAAIYAMRHSGYAYAWFMLAVNMALIASDAAAAPADAFDLAVYRSSATVIGILVVLVVNGLFWPRTGGRAYEHKLAEIRAEFAAHLRRLGIQVSSAVMIESPHALRGAGVALREILAAAALDSGGFRPMRRTYEAQIESVRDLVGSLMAFNEGLRLVAEGEGAAVSADERGLVASALNDLARAVDVLGGTDTATTRAALDDASRGCERLRTSAREPARPGRESALLHAAALQLQVLIGEVQTFADASAAVAAGRRLPPTDLPAARPPVTAPSLSDGLRGGLAAALAYWVTMLIWTELQWPPVGFIGVLMAVVVVGLDALTALPARQPAWAAVLAAVIGLVATAPVYLLAMPRLDGFGELVLVLFPFYYAILYLFHALPRPRNLVVLRVAIIALVMVHLSPGQTYDATAYLSIGASVLTGFVIGVTLLGIFRGMTPRERLRRRLKRLLQTLDAALADLAEPGRPGFGQVVQRHEQVLRAEQQLIAEIAPLAYAPHVPQNDPKRIRALVDAAEALSIRFRALQRARARWVAALAPRGRPAAAVDASGDPQARALARRWRGAFRQAFGALLASIERPYPPVSLSALDATRERALADLQALHDRVGPDAALRRLGIAGHYVGVARALREMAAAVDAIDWAAWRVPRF